MTDYPRNLDDSISDPFDPDSVEAARDSHDRIEAVFIGRRRESPAHHPRDPYDLGWLFLCWSWHAGSRDWKDGVRALARALQAFERLGFIERRTIRRPGYPTHHGFVISDDGREALAALSGDWIEEVR